MAPELRFPIPAERLIPHRAPMQLIAELRDCHDGCGTVSAAAAELLNDGETIAEAALLEMMAQACAACRGYEDLRQGREPAEGYLVAITQADFPEPVPAGASLTVTTVTTTTVGGFAVADARVMLANRCVASASIRIFVPVLAEP